MPSLNLSCRRAGIACAAAVAAAAIAPAPTALAFAPPAIRTVALTLDPVPNLPGHFFNIGFTNGPRPVINAAGHVAFACGTSSTSLNTSGVWSDSSGTLTLLARQNTAAPGDGNFESLAGIPVWLSDNEQVGFAATVLLPAQPGTSGIWAQEGGTLATIARVGLNSPSGPYTLIEGSSFLNFNTLGHAVFRATVDFGPGAGGGATTCLLGGPPSDVHLVARAVLANPPGGFTTLGYPFITDSDVIANYAFYTDPGTSNSGLYVGPASSLAPSIVWNNTVGTAAAGLAPGTNFASAVSPFGLSTTAAGTAIAFTAYLRGGTTTGANDWSLWIKDGAGLRLLLREGDPVPGLPAGVSFRDPTSSSPRSPVVSDSGHVAVVASLQSTDGTFNGRPALVLCSPAGTSRVVAYEGGPASGFAAGSTIASIPNAGNPPCMNRRGQLVYLAYVNVAGGPTNLETIFGTNSRGEARVLWSGGRDVFTIRPGINATLGFLNTPFTGYPLPQGGNDGRRRCFNERGEFVFTATYTRVAPDTGGGYGIFVVTVPNNCNAADIVGLGGTPGGDGQLTADDLIAYLAAFFASNTAIADIASLGGAPTPDGQLTADDLIAFLAAFFAGCP